MKRRGQYRHKRYKPPPLYSPFDIFILTMIWISGLGMVGGIIWMWVEMT